MNVPLIIVSGVSAVGLIGFFIWIIRDILDCPVDWSGGPE